MSEESQPEVVDKLAGISGSARAAILLMALGEQEAADILKLMEPREVQSLGEAMTGISGVSQEQISGVLDTFVGNIQNESSLSIGKQDYLKKTLTRALGRDRAGSMMSQIQMDSGSRGMDALKWMNPGAIAKLICNEHPQIIAIVLSNLEREHAGKVLCQMPKDIQADVVIRVTKLDKVHPAALKELDEIIQQRFEENPEADLTGVGGVKAAAEILNGVSATTEAEIFDVLAEIDAELGNEIQESMFIFENLKTLDDRGMQTLLREVSSEQLVLALKGTTEEMKEKIFKNMSKRAADLLRDDLEAKGPVKLSEVEEAHKIILTAAHRLSEDGSIALGGKGDEFV